MLKEVKNRARGLNIEIDFTDKAVKAISDAGFDPIYGARPLRRAIQSKIEDKLAEEVLKGEAKSGTKVECDYNKKTKQFVFNCL